MCPKSNFFSFLSNLPLHVSCQDYCRVHPAEQALFLTLLALPHASYSVCHTSLPLLLLQQHWNIDLPLRAHHKILGPCSGNLPSWFLLRSALPSPPPPPGHFTVLLCWILDYPLEQGSIANCLLCKTSFVHTGGPVQIINKQTKTSAVRTIMAMDVGDTSRPGGAWPWRPP